MTMLETGKEGILKERYELAIGRIKELLDEKEVGELYQEYFTTVASFLTKIDNVFQKVEGGQFRDLSKEELRTINETLYEDITIEQYRTSYANPDYAVEKLGEKEGQLLSFLYSELRGLIGYAFEGNKYILTIYFELFLEIYHYFVQQEEVNYDNLRQAIYYFMHDYSDVIMEQRIKEMFDPSCSFCTNIIINSDLKDEKYLYYFGEPIGENERKIAQFLSRKTEEEIQSIARTYTEGFRLGFENNNLDLSKKSVVNIRYSIGFERIVKAAIEQFEAMGLKTVIYRYGQLSLNKKLSHRIGYQSTNFNPQYEYDHRYDDGLYLDKSLLAKKLVNLRGAYDKIKDIVGQFAGPAVIEVFGTVPFTPVNKKTVLTHDEKQEKLVLDYQRDAVLLGNEYVKNEESSFTIIAYPIPEIGKEFEEIFDETVKINTLDTKIYGEIQEKIIAALDQGDYVHILGRGNNHTDLKIKLHELKNPEKETNFENCLADVNIPLGEVFTSPQLTGTNGIFHVTQVYLNELKYIDLELKFKDGMVAEYTCKNFEQEEQNRAYIKQNLLFKRESLPIGEFAIGTNTTAYQMGRKYGISHMLPILIAEKTGPHFAIGDTCYSMSEEIKVYNPDGKEIVAKDNECSILRKTEIEKAYFNCHTDITIPYDELKAIEVVTKEGDKIAIIQDGRFVLEGTELLNQPLEEQ